MRISFSLLETYKNCPLKFKYQQLDKIKTPKNIEAVFGNAIHSSLKKLFERTPLFPSLDEVIDHFQNNFAEKVESLNLEPDTIAAYTKEGITLLKNFYKKNPPWNFNVVELESRFSVILEDPENKETHILAGIIDRIDKHEENGAYEIIDYKTYLQEVIQADYSKLARYKLVKSEGPDHNKSFYSVVMIDDEIIGRGEGKSKKDSEQDAAKNTLKTLYNLNL